MASLPRSNHENPKPGLVGKAREPRAQSSWAALITCTFSGDQEAVGTPLWQIVCADLRFFRENVMLMKRSPPIVLGPMGHLTEQWT